MNTGFFGVAFAFGIALIGGVYAFGPVSGGHFSPAVQLRRSTPPFNPAVTVGLAAAGRFAWKDVAGYVVVEIVGGTLATALLFVIMFDSPGADSLGNFASKCWGEALPGGFGLLAVALTEVFATAIFVTIIVGATSNGAINPARSIAAAVFGGGDALMQLSAFIVFPLFGGLIAGFAFGKRFDGTRQVPAS